MVFSADKLVRVHTQYLWKVFRLVYQKRMVGKNKRDLSLEIYCAVEYRYPNCTIVVTVTLFVYHVSSC